MENRCCGVALWTVFCTFAVGPFVGIITCIPFQLMWIPIGCDRCSFDTYAGQQAFEACGQGLVLGILVGLLLGLISGIGVKKVVTENSFLKATMILGGIGAVFTIVLVFGISYILMHSQAYMYAKLGPAAWDVLLVLESVCIGVLLAFTLVALIKKKGCDCKCVGAMLGIEEQSGTVSVDEQETTELV